MTKSKDSRRVMLVCAHRIWNVPPLYNVARLLGAAGYQASVLGYHADGLPTVENLGRGVRILRLKLGARKIRFAPLRKMVATIEFLSAAAAAVRRFQPDFLITFNEPASLLLARCPQVPLRAAWALEYPEFNMCNWAERMLARWSARHWADADWFVAPTPQRLALHLALEPGLIAKRAFVVHNTPLADSTTSVNPSEAGERARHWLGATAKQGKLRIVYAGAVGNRYAIDLLMQAVSAEPEFCLLLLGKKHALSIREVENTLQHCRLDGRFLWVDEIPYGEMQSILRLGDIGFAHYLGDTLNTRFSAPGKLYEYLRAGLALLADDECCLRAEARAADCGAFFPAPGTAEGIRRALGILSARAGQISEMKIRSEQLFVAHFNLEKQMQPMLDALQSWPFSLKH